MDEAERLPSVELAALVSVLGLDEGAYGVSVRAEIEARTGRSPSIAAVYAALERLASRGYVEAWLSEPVAERGGRAKRYYGVTEAGVAAVGREYTAARRLFEGLDLHPTWRRA